MLTEATIAIATSLQILTRSQEQALGLEADLVQTSLSVSEGSDSTPRLIPDSSSLPMYTLGGGVSTTSGSGP